VFYGATMLIVGVCQFGATPVNGNEFCRPYGRQN
jgi:hypothetical protein